MIGNAPLVIVGMSGGVDSSVAASLLLDQGYRVEGLFMKNWNEDDGSEYCTARADLDDATAVVGSLGIRLHTANFAAEYWDRVFEYFLAEYRAGRTPNPDVLCNREIKFAVFADYARQLGADHIATGHYARSSLDQGGQTRLLKARDANKDQTYFLHAVSAAQLAPCLFPLGGLLKPAVREIARRRGLPTHAKKDSTGICFIGERRFADFLARYLPAQPGYIESLEGQRLGEHAGLMFYTIGQRQGLGIGGRRDRGEQPWYVVDKDLPRNLLLVAQGRDHPALFHSRLAGTDSHWIGEPPPEGRDLHLQARIRHRQADQSCTLRRRGDNVDVAFEVPQRAVTPGQFIVFYRGEECLGGATIMARQP